MKARIPEYFVVANSFLEVSIQVLGVSSKTMERERALGGCSLLVYCDNSIRRAFLVFGV
jgi:hypothetical protein